MVGCPECDLDTKSVRRIAVLSGGLCHTIHNTSSHFAVYSTSKRAELRPYQPEVAFFIKVSKIMKISFKVIIVNIFEVYFMKCFSYRSVIFYVGYTILFFIQFQGNHLLI